MFKEFLKLQKYKLILFLSVIFFYSCANIQPPSGGPKDTEPPRVIHSYPLDKTLNYKKDFVEIEFSEWVNRNQVTQNIMISPVSEVSFKWSGRTLKIVFPKARKENSTYLVSLGTEYSDNSGNKPDSSFSLTFATGNTIDSGRIDGFVYGEKVNGSFVYAYQLNNKNPDTLNPEVTPAEYRTQLGNTGSFSLLALPDGNYRIIVVKTQFRDNLFHSKYDEFGTYWEDVRVEQGKSKYVTMKLGKYPDYSPISINSVFKIDSNKLLLEFNKLVKLSNNSLNLFELIDSTLSKKVSINSIYFDSIFSKRMVIITKDIINNLSVAKVIISSNFVIDTFLIGNKAINEYFKIGVRNYNNPFEINRIPIKDSSQTIENIQEITFSFNKFFTIVDSTLIELTNTLSNKQIQKKLIIDGNALKIVLIDPLTPDGWYKLSIDLSKIKSIEGEKISDTTIVYNFKTEDWKQFPSVSGKLLDSVGCSNIAINLKSIQFMNNRQINIQSSGNWTISEVKPDKYYVELYCDQNYNGRYDYGIAFPYKYSEKFLVTKQEVEVKPRWDVQNILLFFKLP